MGGTPVFSNDSSEKQFAKDCVRRRLKKNLKSKNKKAKNPLPSRSNNGNRFVTEIKFNNDAQVNADGVRTLNSTAKTADNKKTLKYFYRIEEHLKLLLSLFPRTAVASVVLRKEIEAGKAAKVVAIKL